MTGTLRVRRSRGALSGVLLVLLGIWGALIPFVGPYFHYAYSPDQSWHYTTGRLWLEILPGIAVMLGGAVVLISKHRLAAILGSWLAAAGGAWFAVGGLVAAHWTSLPSAGTPTGGPARMVLEQIGFFIGLGVVVVFFAALAMGRFTVVSARDRDRMAAAEAEEPVLDEDTTESQPAWRRLRLPAPVVRSKSAAGEPAESEPVR